MSFTVSATATNISEAVVLKVYVLTAGTEAGGAVTTAVAFGAPTFSLTPNASTSLIVESDYESVNSGAALTPNASNTTDSSGSTPNLAQPWWFGHWTGTVTSGTAITTLGGTNGDQWNAYAAYEVKASGGSTPAIDASTPAAADSTTSPVTTASFTPPAGAVLVALAVSNGSATQAFSVSDTSGLGLTWTQRGTTASSAFEGSSAVFTTTIPGGGSTTANAGLAAATGTAQQPVPVITPHPGLPAGTGTAQPPVPAVTASAGLATGTGTALQPTVNTSGNTTANAGLATGTGISQGPAVTVAVPAGLAAGTGTAQAPVPGITGRAGAATGTGTALSVPFSGPSYLYLGQEACTYLDYLDLATGHVLSPVPGNSYQMMVASGRNAYLTVPPPGRPWSPGDAGAGGTFAPLVMSRPATEDYAVMLARGRRHNSAMHAAWAQGVLPRGEPPSEDLHKQLGCCPDP